MHVALNALCITNRSGTGRYAWGLIDGFFQSAESDLQLSVLIPSDFSLPVEWRNSECIRFYSVPVQSTLHRIFWEQWSLPGWLRWIPPDLLHSPAFIAPVLRSSKTKHVVTIHDLAFLRYPNTIPRMRRFFYRWIIPNSWHLADAVITDSLAVRDELDTIVDLPRIESVHLGVDATQFNSKASDGDEAVFERYRLSKGYLLFVGTREPRKNLDTLLAAYSLARQKGFSDPLAIVGRYGWMDERSQDIPGVRWLGRVPNADLPALYRGASVFLAPSLYEGFDLPPVEALACGAPVIASDIAVHREILGNNAVFVSCCDSVSWAEAICKGIQEPPRISPRCWRHVAMETLAVYRKLTRA